MLQVKTWEMEFCGKKLVVETGKLALHAGASVTVKYGDTVVLATATMSKEPREGIDFFPLMVDYEEKMYAAGKIKGSRFIKREGRPSDEAVLNSRLIDRALRPLFADEIKNDVQIILSVLSFDEENDPDVPSLIAGSIALTISEIPWESPIASCLVNIIDGEFVINPSHEIREKSDMELTVAGDGEKVIMIEAGVNEVQEDKVYEAIAFANGHIKKVVEFIKGIAKDVKPQKISMKKIEALSAEEESDEGPETSTIQEVLQKTKVFLKENADKYIFNAPKASKMERKIMAEDLEKALDKHLKEQGIGKEKRKKVLVEVKKFIEEEVMRAIIEEEKRVDGRGCDDIRELNAEVSLLPRTHGSGLFNRGETQVLSVVTLGSPGDAQIIDGMEVNEKKRYMHHYNFPPFSVGEVRPQRGPGRREIGHGALAERALEPMLPDKEAFPYTIRVVSEVLGSNGSSSMGSVCGSTLALMDAGVPIKKPVAGIAMGLASDNKGRYKIITDLQDLEDGIGGMDFKVAGTRDGITAIQLDTKTKGLSMEIVKETLERAHKARLKILAVMENAISETRKELSPYAPRIMSMQIPTEKIGLVIGPSGKTINEIIEITGVQIDIEDDGLIMITAKDIESGEAAKKRISDLTREIKEGELFEGKVTRIMDFGAFVELLPGREGMVHVSKLAQGHVERVSAVVDIDDMLKVKVIEIDDKKRINLCVVDDNGDCVSRNGTGRPAGRQTGNNRSYLGHHRGNGSGRDRGGFSKPRR